MKRFFFLLLAALFCALPAAAHTLEVRVVEVLDGKTLTVENTGRRFKVFLKIADAPEADQPYGDIARRHLSGLVLNRPATVEYLGLGQGAVLVGRVYCEGRDVGLQMIRDGVAWYDRRYEEDLNEAERRVYSDSERAARDEHRGVWTDPSPVPPWEWRLSKGAAPAAPKASAAVPTKPAAPVSQTSAPTAAKGVVPIVRAPQPAAHAAPAQWPLFSPDGTAFSVRMPGGGRKFTRELTTPDGRPVTLSIYQTRLLKVVYTAVWMSGPYWGEGLDDAFERARDFLNEAAAAHNLPCEFVLSKDTPSGGYTGRRYTIRGCYLQGSLRFYYKVAGKTLTIYAAGVTSEVPDDPSVKEFLDSFKLN